MIDRTLPAVPWANENALHLAMESFALSCLASYNLDTLPARTLNSFKRAWGITDLAAHPRVGAVPAYVYAAWRDGAGKHVRDTIAIEGSTSLGQIFLYGASGLANPAGCTGHVIQKASDWAAAIIADMEAHEIGWGQWKAAEGTNLIVAGFSLGGAVAEVLSALAMKTRRRRMRLLKFGAPRVGTAAWETADQLPPQRMNYYCGSDGVCNIPVSQQNNIAGVYRDIWSPVFAFMAAPNPVNRLSLTGQGMPPGLNGSSNDAPFVYRQSLLSLTPSNPWYFHQLEAYRLMFCNLANDSNDNLKYRMLYLEFPDDNQWQVNYTPGTQDFGTLKGLGADPADKVVAVSAEEEAALNPGSGGGDYGDWGSGGGDYGPIEPERVIVRVNPARVATPAALRLRSRAR